MTLTLILILNKRSLSLTMRTILIPSSWRKTSISLTLKTSKLSSRHWTFSARPSTKDWETTKSPSSNWCHSSVVWVTQKPRSSSTNCKTTQILRLTELAKSTLMKLLTNLLKRNSQRSVRKRTIWKRIDTDWRRPSLTMLTRSACQLMNAKSRISSETDLH